MAYQLIRVVERFDGRVAEIILGPPPGNLIRGRLIEEVAEEIRRHQLGAAPTRRRRAIVIAGEGAHFSYGADVAEHRPEAIRDVLPAFHRFIGELLACPVPTIARVRGLCLGGGFEIALACSMVAASDTAAFGLPEIRLGALPPVASALLPHKLPSNVATRMIVGGEHVTASDLNRFGLVNLLAPDASLDAALNEWVERELLPRSASSLRLATTAAGMSLASDYRARIGELESLYLDTLMKTRDAVEGVEAFLAKRPPDWRDE